MAVTANPEQQLAAQAGDQDGVPRVGWAKPGRDVSPKRPSFDLRGRLGEASLASSTPPSAEGQQFLTVNMVMPAMGDTAKEAASLGPLLLTLAALAFERFGAARENDSPDAPREPAPSCRAGFPADPFDGQLLRFRKEDSGYAFHNLAPDLASE